MQAAHDLHVHLGWTVAVYDLGEALANLVQPFWMLPTLALLGLKARDVMGFTFVVFLVLVPVVLVLVTVLGSHARLPAIGNGRRGRPRRGRGGRRGRWGRGRGGTRGCARRRAAVEVQVAEQVEELVAGRLVGREGAAGVEDGVGRDDDDARGVDVTREAAAGQLVDLAGEGEGAGRGDARDEVGGVSAPGGLGRETRVAEVDAGGERRRTRVARGELVRGWGPTS